MVVMTDAPKTSVRRGMFEGMYYEVHGAGPPLIALHGFGENSFAWRFLAPVLARTHEVHVLDLLGHGRAEKPSGGAYAPEAHARRVAAYIAAGQLDAPVLMGHSMGGGVALFLTIDRVNQGLPPPAALVLIDTMYFGMRVPAFIKALRVPGLAQMMTGLVPPRISARVILETAIYDRRRITPEMVDAYAEPMRTAAGRNAIIETARQIESAQGAAYAAQIGKISSPCLLLWGRQDQITPLALGEVLAKSLTRATMRIVENCGHCPNEEQPDAAIAAVTDFLAANR